MYLKMTDIMTIVSEHQPHIFGLAEANIKSSHNQSDIQIPDYSIHLPFSLNDPALGNLARVAVYTHKLFTVKRRADLKQTF